MRPWLMAIAMVAGCGGPRGDDLPRQPSPVAATRPIATGAPRWIAGDLHQHMAPFDAREGAAPSVAELVALAEAHGLEFVIATPHVYPGTFADAGRRRAWLAQWQVMAAEARVAHGATIIPGAEYTVGGFGHFGVSGVDFAALDGGDVLAAAHTAGGFVVVNHPFAVPTQIPGIPISDRDLSFRPWTEGTGRAPFVDGVEVWNLPLGLANIASRPGGLTGEARAFAAADALARREHRRVAVVGGSDSHRQYVVATTWVRAADASEASIMAGLRAGAVCVGGPEAGTLTARGDADAPDRWAAIGDIAHGDRVELRWTGTASLFVDGAPRGDFDGGWTDDHATGPHTYRITIGQSRCGFVYANLD